MRDDVVRHYTRDGITVTWQPALCVHSGICARGLPQVFNPRRRPWIELHHTGRDVVTEQVDRCPSGALSWKAAADEV